MKLSEVTKPNIVAPKTVKELILNYKTYGNYKNLAYKSQKDYDYYLSSIAMSPYGEKPLEYFSPVICDLLYQQTKQDNGLHSAKQLVGIFSVVYAFAQSKEWVTLNPWSLVKRAAPKPRDAVWTREEIEKVVTKAVELGETEVAKCISLLYDTGQRPGDVLSWTYNDLKKDEHGWYVEFRQHKTGAKVCSSISSTTCRLLGVGGDILGSQKLVGRTIPLDLFRTYFRRVCNEVGIPKTLQLRDIRRTAITEAGEASDDQIKAMSGHKNRAMLDTYSVATRKKSLAAFNVRNLNGE